MKYMALLGSIIIVIISSALTQKELISTLGFKDKLNILNVFTVTSMGKIKNCDYGRWDYVKCKNIPLVGIKQLNRARSFALEKPKVYIDNKTLQGLHNITINLNLTFSATNLFDLSYISNWRDPPKHFSFV